jgi:hypothetical protein
LSSPQALCQGWALCGIDTTDAQRPTEGRHHMNWLKGLLLAAVAAALALVLSGCAP